MDTRDHLATLPSACASGARMRLPAGRGSLTASARARTARLSYPAEPATAAYSAPRHPGQVTCLLLPRNLRDWV